MTLQTSTKMLAQLPWKESIPVPAFMWRHDITKILLQPSSEILGLLGCENLLANFVWYQIRCQRYIVKFVYLDHPKSRPSLTKTLFARPSLLLLFPHPVSKKIRDHFGDIQKWLLRLLLDSGKSGRNSRISLKCITISYYIAQLFKVPFHCWNFNKKIALKWIELFIIEWGKFNRYYLHDCESLRQVHLVKS